jgi:hypothetical protein
MFNRYTQPIVRYVVEQDDSCWKSLTEAKQRVDALKENNPESKSLIWVFVLTKTELHI